MTPVSNVYRLSRLRDIAALGLTIPRPHDSHLKQFPTGFCAATVMHLRRQLSRKDVDEQFVVQDALQHIGLPVDLASIHLVE